MNSMIQASLNFPEQFFKKFDLTQQEIEESMIWFRSIFDYDKDIDESNTHYGQLIKLIALGNRYSRIKKGLKYLEIEFRIHIHPNWRPAYNLLFFAMSSNEASASIDTVSRVLYKNQFDNIKPEQQKACYEIRVCMREIYCLTQLIRTRIHENKDPVIQDLYNLIDKFNLIFTKLFGFKVHILRKKFMILRFRRNSSHQLEYA